MNYVVIIPAKNEEENIGQTLSSLINQTLQPKSVVVVDNGSEDKTANIVKGIGAKHQFIKYFNYTGHANKYALGGKIVKIFKEGKAFVDSLGIPYDYLVKMDADISMEDDIFERIAQKIQDQNYGIVSPLGFFMQNGRKVFISTPDWHTSGDFKIYNRLFLEKVGGLMEDLGWDCADNIAARELGFDTKVFRDIHYEQTRPIGRFSLVNGWKRQGIGAYKLRYSFPYLMLKSTHDLFRPPYIAGSAYYLFGYLSALFDRPNKTLTKKQGRLLRNLLWHSFFDRLKRGHFVLFQGFGKKRKQNPT